jgi:hypothetical protein
MSGRLVPDEYCKVDLFLSSMEKETSSARRMATDGAQLAVLRVEVKIM